MIINIKFQTYEKIKNLYYIPFIASINARGFIFAPMHLHIELMDLLDKILFRILDFKIFNF